MDLIGLGHLPRRPALLGHAARDRPLRDGQEVRHEGHPLLRRLRPDAVVHPARRDRVRHQGACRSAASSRSSGCTRSTTWTTRPTSRGRSAATGLAADRGALRGLVHALRAGLPADLRPGARHRHRRTRTPPSGGTVSTCVAATTDPAEQRHLHRVGPGVPGQAGRAAPRRPGHAFNGAPVSNWTPARQRDPQGPGRAGADHGEAGRQDADPARHAGHGRAAAAAALPGHRARPRVPAAHPGPRASSTRVGVSGRSLVGVGQGWSPPCPARCPSCSARTGAARARRPGQRGRRGRGHRRGGRRHVGWQSKVSFVLLLVASLNIFVGAFNMLPLLPLDGGHVAARSGSGSGPGSPGCGGSPTRAWWTWRSCCR